MGLLRFIRYILKFKKKAGELMNNIISLKEAIRSLSLESYVQGGTLAKCLPAYLWQSMEMDKIDLDADEFWHNGDFKVLTYNFDGYAVNITFHQDSRYLYDSVDVWDITDTVVATIGRLSTTHAIEHWSAICGMKLHRFEMTDERVYLWPNAVTVHYHLQHDQWLLSKVAGAYRSYEDTFASLQAIAQSL